MTQVDNTFSRSISTRPFLQVLDFSKHTQRHPHLHFENQRGAEFRRKTRSTMAQSFLDGLPQVDLKTLPPESCCTICQNLYGTETKEGGAGERVVRLPCGHNFGADCIRTWLSPDREARNSCPACRTTFFPAQPRPYMDHGAIQEGEDEDEDEDEGQDNDDDEEGEDDWHGAHGRVNPPRRTNAGIFYQDVLRMVGEAGQPPREGEEVPQVEAREEHNRDRIRRWWPAFFGTTTDQYQDSIRRARAVITMPRVPIPGANINFCTPYPHLQLGASALSNLEELDPQHIDRVVQTLATAFRTLSFREAVVYSILRDFRADTQIPTTAEDGLRALSAEQEELLFREMERAGAFPDIDPASQYAGLNNRERWQMHREKYGETWNPHTGLWSPDWS